MKVKLIEIKLVETTLNKLMEADLNIKLAYRLSKLLKKVNQEMQDMEEGRVRLIKKYASSEGKEGEDVKVADGNLEAFRQDFSTLLNEEVNFDFDPLKIEDLLDMKISPIDILRLQQCDILEGDNDGEGEIIEITEEQEEVETETVSV